MRILQLWYGWAPKGVEAAYSRQVIAGTGELADPRNGYTQHVKQWCGYTTRPAFGWIERRGVVVAFTRTPTGKERRPGRDQSRLRDGTHFAHALVWAAPDASRDILARLWKASIWHLAPPDDPPINLPVIVAVDELGGRPSVGIPRADAERSIAAFLYNTAHGLRCAVALPDELAIAHGAAIADVMPTAFAVPSFSTWEEPDQREEYDILASLDPIRHFEPIAPDVDRGEPWLTAARLLIDARAGDDVIQDVVDALSDGAPDLGGFAVGLARWAQLEDPEAGLMRSSAAGMAILASDARLLDRTLERHGVRDLARGMADGHSVDAIMACARDAGRTAVIAEALEHEVAGRSPTEVMTAIDEVLKALGPRGIEVVGGLADTWLDAGTLERLTSDQMLVLTRLLARSSLRPAVAALLRSDVATAAIVADDILPTDWRGRAAAAHPERVSTAQLIALLHDTPSIAETFGEHAQGAALAVLAHGLDTCIDLYAMRVVQNVSRGLGASAAGALALPVVRRIADPHERWAAVQSFAAPARALDAEWGHELIDAYARLVVEMRSTVVSLPRLQPDRLPHLEQARLRAWRVVLEGVGATEYRSAMHLGSIRRAADAAATLSTPYDREAAFELVIDRAADAELSHDSWLEAVGATASASQELARPFADRLARAALRETGCSRRRVARRTILWVAYQIDERRLSSSDAYESRLNDLWRRLHRHDAGVLAEQAKRYGLMSSARAWLVKNRDRVANTG